MRDCNRCVRKNSPACAICGDGRGMYVDDGTGAGLCVNELRALEAEVYKTLVRYAEPSTPVAEICNLMKGFTKSIVNTWNKENDNGS